MILLLVVSGSDPGHIKAATAGKHACMIGKGPGDESVGAGVVGKRTLIAKTEEIGEYIGAEFHNVPRSQPVDTDGDDMLDGV